MTRISLLIATMASLAFGGTDRTHPLRATALRPEGSPLLRDVPTIRWTAAAEKIGDALAKDFDPEPVRLQLAWLMSRIPADAYDLDANGVLRCLGAFAAHKLDMKEFRETVEKPLLSLSSLIARSAAAAGYKVERTELQTTPETHRLVLYLSDGKHNATSYRLEVTPYGNNVDEEFRLIRIDKKELDLATILGRKAVLPNGQRVENDSAHLYLPFARETEARCARHGEPTLPVERPPLPEGNRWGYFDNPAIYALKQLFPGDRESFDREIPPPPPYPGDPSGGPPAPELPPLRFR